MTTLSDLYLRVRAQTDTTTAELPDTLINAYLNEAFNRTIAAENLWPFYEQTWELTLPAGQYALTKPGDLNEPGITGLWDVAASFRLQQMDYEKALDVFGGVNGALGGPHAYAMWGNLINLFPAVPFAEDRLYVMIGFRRPKAWSTITASQEPDCDERLHLPLVHYATALAYAREEGTELERTYMERWQKDVEMARQAIMEANRQRPLVMGPHYITPIGRGGRSFGSSATLNPVPATFIVDADGNLVVQDGTPLIYPGRRGT